MLSSKTSILIIGTELNPPYTCMEAKIFQFILDAESISAEPQIHALSINITKPSTDSQNFTYVNGLQHGPVWLRKLSYGLSLLLTLEKSISSNIKIVHLLWVGFPVLTSYIIKRLKSKNIKVIVTILNRHIDPFRYQLADHLIFHSDSSKQKYNELGFPETKLQLLPPPVDRTRFKPIYKRPESFFIMASGPRTPKQIEVRGIHLLFKAFSLLQQRKTNIKLEFFGRWPEGALVLEKLRIKYGLKNVVMHHTHQSNLPDRIARSSGVIVPFTGACIGDVPMSALESLACGRPVIATVDLGLYEYLVVHKSGIIIEPDPVTLADAIEKINSTPDAWFDNAIKAVQKCSGSYYGKYMQQLYQVMSNNK